MEEDFRRQFAARLAQELDKRELSQNQLAQAIGVSRSTVTGWLRHGKLPDAYILAQICQTLDISADMFLGLETYIEKTSLSGKVRWQEFIPPYIEGFHREHIQQGIHLFNELLNESGTTSQIISDHNLRYLQSALQTALRSGAIRLTYVERNEDYENQLRQRYPTLKNVVVASIPASCDATIIHAELVSFLAATEVLSHIIRENVVGLGTGYTLLRMCEQSIPSIDGFNGTNWLPLVTFTDDNVSGYTANQLAKLMQIRHPGSQGIFLPHPAHTETNSLLQKDFDYAVRLMQTMQTVFLTVNGVGRRDRTLKNHPLTDFRTVDYAYDSAYLRDRFADLTQPEAFGGELLSYLIDTDGQIIDTDRERVWQVDLDILRYNSDLVGKVVVVAARDYKAQAVATCLKNGLCNALVIDDEIAEYLLE